MREAARYSPLSRAEYDRMVARGELDDERVELLRGELVAMSPQGPPHATAVRKLIKLFTRAPVSERMQGLEIQAQSPLAVGDHSEPEPDFAVIEAGDYTSEHPMTARLVVEVSDSSLAKDRRIKTTLYAECGVPEYWIVNLDARVIEVYTEPGAGGYGSRVVRSEGDVIDPVALPGMRIAVSDVL